MTSYLNVRKSLRKATGPGSPDRGVISHAKNEFLSKKENLGSSAVSKNSIWSNEGTSTPIPAKVVELLQKLKQCGVVGDGKTTQGENEIAACFAKVGANDHFIKSIHIQEDPRFCHVSNAAVVDFGRSLRFNFHLHTLVIHKCELGNAFLSELAESIKHNMILQKIDLRGNNFTSDSLVEFCLALSENKTVQHVNLSAQHSPINSQQEENVLDALERNHTIQSLDIEFRSTSCTHRLQKILERNRKNSSSAQFDEKRIIAFLEQELAEAKQKVEEAQAFDVEDLPSRISEADHSYFTELLDLSDQYSVEIAVSGDATKEKEKVATTVPVDMPTSGKMQFAKTLLAKSLVLPQTNMKASGEFLDHEYVNSFLKEEEKTGALVFDYTNQVKLFKRFTMEDPARSTIVAKFIDAIVTHPRAHAINVLNLANALLADDFLTALCERCTKEKKLANLHIINLETNLLVGPGIAALSDALSKIGVWSYLHCVRLDNQKSPIDTNAEMKLAHGLHLNRSVIRLSLRVRNLSARDQINKAVQRNIDYLRQARALRQRKSGTAPKRSRNRVETFFDKVKENDATVTEVDFVGDQVFLALNSASRLQVAASFSGNSYVKSVKLSLLKLDDSFAKELAKSLPSNNSITKLSLENNAIGSEGVLAIVEGLASNTTLEELQIRHQSKTIDSTTETKIIEALDRNDFIVKFGIDLRGQKAKIDLEKKLRENQERKRKRRNGGSSQSTSSMIKSNETDLLLAKVEKNDPSVCEVVLTGDKEFIGMPQQRKLSFIDSLASNSYLKTLVLDGLSLDNVMAERLAESLRKNEQLETLSVNKSAFTSPGVRSICEAACQSSLKELSILKPRFKLTSEDTVAILNALESSHKSSITKIDVELRESEHSTKLESLLARNK